MLNIYPWKYGYHIFTWVPDIFNPRVSHSRDIIKSLVVVIVLLRKSVFPHRLMLFFELFLKVTSEKIWTNALKNLRTTPNHSWISKACHHFKEYYNISNYHAIHPLKFIWTIRNLYRSHIHIIKLKSWVRTRWCDWRLYKSWRNMTCLSAFQINCQIKWHILSYY